MPTSPAAIISYTRTDLGRKTVRYAAVSLIAIAVAQTTIALCYGLLRWNETPSQLTAFVTSTIPSYYLNRAWVWSKNGKSSLHKEIIPFWGIGVAQLLISLAFVAWAQTLVENATDSHLLRTVGIQFNTLLIYGLMWVGKFFFFNKVLFVHKPEDSGSAATSDAR